MVLDELKHVIRRRKEDRRRRYVSLYKEFAKTLPGHNPVRLIARDENVSCWTVYAVLKGRR